LNTGVPNEFTYFGARETVYDFEGLTGLLEIQLCTENQSDSNSHNCEKQSEISTPILARISLREWPFSSQIFNSASDLFHLAWNVSS
jgi:hypothetical protein